MFGHTARAAARPAMAAAAAVAAANAAQGSAHARAPAQGSARPVAHPQVHNKIVDRDTEGWVLAEVQDEMVLFQPFDSREVDEAASTVMAMFGRPPHQTSTVVPLGSEPEPYGIYDDALAGARGHSTSGCSSETEGESANAVIEGAGGWRREREQMEALMTLTTKMLRRPGMQREVVMCMLEDPDIRELMLKQCNDLDRYLEAAGIPPNPQLLPAAPSPLIEVADADNTAAASHPDGAACSRSAADGPNLMSRVVGAVAGALEKAGDALAALGGWLRRYVSALVPEAAEAEEVQDGEAETAEERVEGEEEYARGGGMPSSAPQRPKRTANQLLGGVMVLAVAVFCVAIIRRPLVLRAMRR